MAKLSYRRPAIRYEWNEGISVHVAAVTPSSG
jgi:hypothetical protein